MNAVFFPRPSGDPRALALRLNGQHLAVLNIDDGRQLGIFRAVRAIDLTAGKAQHAITLMRRFLQFPFEQFRAALAHHFKRDRQLGEIWIAGEIFAAPVDDFPVDDPSARHLLLGADIGASA